MTNKKTKREKAQKKPSHQEKELTREEFHGLVSYSEPLAVAITYAPLLVEFLNFFPSL